MTQKLHVPKVQEMMSKKVIALAPDCTTIDAIHLLNHYRISSLPIVSPEKKILGFISDIDCLSQIGSSLFYDEVKEVPLSQVMKTDVVSLSEEMDFFEAESFFVKNQLHHAPIVDKEGYLVGTLSRRDLMKALEEALKQTLDHKKELKTPLEFTFKDRIKFFS